MAQTPTDSGYRSAGTGANETSIGSTAWTNFGDIISSNEVKADNVLSLITDFDVEDYSIRLVKGGIIQGNDNSVGTNWPITDAYDEVGGSSDMWGLQLLPADVNASDFGFVVACRRVGTTPISNYLKSTNYGFTIKSNNKVVGVAASFERSYTNSLGASFAEGTMVSTPYGELPIERVKPGMPVISFNKRLRIFEKGIAVKTKFRYVKDIMFIRVGGRILPVTSNHKIFTPKDHIRAGRIKPGIQLVGILSGVPIPRVVEHVSKHKGNFKVYDIQVEGNHSYVANGIASYNLLISGSTTAYVDHMRMRIFTLPLRDSIECETAFVPVARK